LFGDRSRPWIGGFFTLCLALLLLTGWLIGLSWPFYAGLVLAAAHAAWQTASAKFDDPKNCLVRFKSNRDFGLIVLAAIVAGQIA
jgi:4-hydroxybenzoate polyprenyltransferase